MARAMSGQQLEQWLDLVRQQLRSLQYGVVQIVVHDSAIVQIDRTEKLRLETVKNPTPIHSAKAD